jgi:alanine-synthesizing transaminase
MLSSMRLCSNVQSQYVIKTALSDIHKCDDTLLPGGRIYEQREYIVNTLNNIPGLQVFKPKAAFYVFPRIDTKRFNITDDEKFILDFLHEKHILMVHGRGFNWSLPDHFRIVYLPKIEELKFACDCLGDFLEGYRQA